MSDEQNNDAIAVGGAIPGLVGTPTVALPNKEELLAKITKSTGMEPEVIELIKSTIAPTLTWRELEAGLYMAAKRKLDPMKKQISFIKFGGKMQTIVTIDGQRTLAARSGNYLGSTITYIYNVGGTNVESEFPPSDKAVLVGAKATVTKRCGSQTGTFTAVAFVDEYLKDSSSSNSKKMPHVMIAKDAEALALRKAFPEDLSGFYEEAEFDNVEAV